MRTLVAGLFLSTALLFALPAGAVATPSWQGTWDTNWGPLVIGASEATFGYSDSWNEPLGHFRELKPDGATLTGSWSHDPPSHFAPRDHGTFTLHMTVTSGKATFTGTIVYAYNGETAELRGTCKSGACAAAATDATAPTVKALSAGGKTGATIVLRWQANDDSGRTTDVLTVRRGTTKVWTGRTTHAVKSGQTYSMSFRAPKTKGTLRFTVESTDKAGNTASSSATVTVR